MTKLRTDEEYYLESRRYREEVLQIADALKDSPLRFTITNVITMEVESTKSDLKTVASKNTQDNRFNAFKNKLAQDIKGFIEKATYEGWRGCPQLLEHPLFELRYNGHNHMKVFIFDNECAYIGSANITIGNALRKWQRILIKN